MDEDTERGIIFTLGILLGLGAMWVIFTARGRRTAKQVFEAAGDLVEDLGDQTGEIVEQATEAAGSLRQRFR